MTAPDPIVVDYLASYAAAAGVDAPTPDEIDQLLELAGHAAHASARQAAPVTTWLAARAGLSPAAALELARTLESS